MYADTECLTFLTEAIQPNHISIANLIEFSHFKLAYIPVKKYHVNFVKKRFHQKFCLFPHNLKHYFKKC